MYTPDINMPETLCKDSNKIKCKEFIYKKYQYVNILYFTMGKLIIISDLAKNQNIESPLKYP